MSTLLNISAISPSLFQSSRFISVKQRLCSLGTSLSSYLAEVYNMAIFFKWLMSKYSKNPAYRRDAAPSNGTAGTMFNQINF